ncbi:MAG TPA: endopeptidase La [bacterium]|nr:endopeptidase La [bacterium]
MDYDPLKEEQVDVPENIVNYPLIPLRDIVIFPHMIVPLFIGRGKSIKALEECMMDDRKIIVTAQKQPGIEDPEPEELYGVGTLCEVLNMIKLPDGTIKVLIEGTHRMQIMDFLVSDDYFAVRALRIEEDERKDLETEAMMRDVLNKFDKYVRLTRSLPPEAYTSATSIEEPCRLSDLIASQLVLKVDMKQKVLEAFKPGDRLIQLSEILDEELEILDIQKKIQGQVKRQIEQSQREYYLREQLKAIQKELGSIDEQSEEQADIRKRMKKAKLPDYAAEKVEAELKRLLKMPSGTAEAVVVRNYIDWILDIPWSKETEEDLNIKQVKTILDEDHYGLDKVKERIIEYLAVRRLSEKGEGVILCLVGPPGTGKTSLGKSIARALNRKYVRASLGGVRDEAEIRGHRRTYIGSMPGRIIQQMKKAAVVNPLFLLDEVDKMSTDFRGDPAAALLEVLDPEMNSEFADHYLEIPYDLSKVMFITTANLVQPIPAPLLDRMEVIQMTSYTEDEKMNIARRHLLPRQLEKHGLDPGSINISDEIFLEIIRRYTREAGVRNLERQLAHICRKHASNSVRKLQSKDVLNGKPGKKKAAGKEKKPQIPKIRLTKQSLSKYIGPPRYRYGRIGEKDETGVATGMAWTQTGGEILNIEVTLMPGKGNLILTGLLGDVMKESAQAAVSYSRSKADEFELKKDYFQKYDIHLHVPEGAIPKDGPSAGVALTTALVSALTGRPVDRNLAMTGEITLRGKVLPVGGIKEKVLAAHRAGITKVVLPVDNEKDYIEIQENVIRDLNIIFVETIDQVLDAALMDKKVVSNKAKTGASRGGTANGTGKKSK